MESGTKKILLTVTRPGSQNFVGCQFQVEVFFA